MRLTRAGNLFVEHVPRIFTALQQARESVKASANGFHGQLRIALSDGFMPTQIPALISLCTQNTPDFSVCHSEVPLSQQIERMHGNLSDAGDSHRMALACVGDPTLVSGWLPPCLKTKEGFNLVPR